VPHGGGIGGKKCYILPSEQPLVGPAATLGVPLAIPPKIRCITAFPPYDPVPNIRCVMNTLPYSGSGARLFRKMALLRNNVSPPTDSDGTTTFHNLTFVASNTHAQIPLYNCEGEFTLDPTSRPAAQPLLLSTPVASIQMTTTTGDPLPSEVVEGESFSTSVLLTDVGGKPVEGHVVVAMVMEEAGGMRYSSERLSASSASEGDDGCVLCQLPGLHSKKLTGTVFSLRSNANGVAVFSGLRFSTLGPAGSYRIAFFHGGLPRLDPKNVIVVKSRVASLSLISGSTMTDYTALINATSGADGSLFELPAILITDAKGNGIQGKSLRITCVQEGDNADGHVVLSYSVDDGVESISNEGSGVYEILSLRFLVAKTGTYTLLFDVEGLEGAATSSLLKNVNVVNGDPDTNDPKQSPCAHIRTGMHGHPSVDDFHTLPTIAITSNQRAFNIPATTPIVVNSHGSPVVSLWSKNIFF